MVDGELCEPIERVTADVPMEQWASSPSARQPPRPDGEYAALRRRVTPRVLVASRGLIGFAVIF